MRPFLFRLFLFAVVLCLLLEGVFRTVIPAAEKPFTSSESKYGIFHYREAIGRSGQFSAGRLAQIRTRWHINNAGWNSAVDYLPSSQRTKPLIAILGNSYVEGLHVDVDDNLAANLRRVAGDQYDVYSFGIADAPFSHNIQLSRYVNEYFDPDIVVVINTGNRIKPSLASSGRMPLYLQLARDGRSFREIPPQARTISEVRRILSNSALVRYLALNSRFRPGLSRPSKVAAIVKGADQEPTSGQAEEATALKTDVIGYVLGRLKQENASRRMLVVMDAHRWSMYTIRGPRELLVNKIMAEVAAEDDVPCVDLTQPFRAQWEVDRLPFEYEHEYHWNAHGHRVVANTIALELDLIEDSHQDPTLSATRVKRADEED